jgi:nitrogen-specific signal transduction histidine kinase/ActR/RegA family two-component response regulator
MLTDISDRKRLERQLIQAQKMEAIGTLAGGIAHDFNNILFPIIGYTEMLLADNPGDGTLRKSLERILYGANSARELVGQILTFSRRRDDELKPHKLQFSLKEVVKLVRSLLPATIEISQDISREVRPVLADPTQIHQIVMNLITNAFHAMEIGGGKLSISLKEEDVTEENRPLPSMKPGPYACLGVADTGIGMDPATLNRIFDPYFTTKTEGKGTGLGLAVVHGIVKAHGGHILTRSEPGKGSVFEIYLPVIPSPGQGAGAEPGEGTRQAVEPGRERILLVDDSQQIVTMVHFFLEKQGYRVTPCINSRTALETFAADPDGFDLIITDLTMPEMTGRDLARRVFEIRPGMPVILCTGFSSLMTEEAASAMGIKGFLLKPVNTADLAGTIRRVLGGNAPRSPGDSGGNPELSP